MVLQDGKVAIHDVSTIILCQRVNHFYTNMLSYAVGEEKHKKNIKAHLL